MWLVGGRWPLTLTSQQKGSCLNCFNKIIKKNSSLASLARVYSLISYIKLGRPINFSAFIFASAKVILFWCFYCYNHADFDRKLINQAFRYVLFFPYFFLTFFFFLLFLIPTFSL